jgi:hypothetical protein
MAKNTIILKGDPLRKEAIAGGAIIPGDLITWSSGDVIVNATAADADAQRMVAVENDLRGDDIDTAYAEDDQVQYVVPRQGDELYMWIEANNAAVAIGAALESAGGGDLQTHTTGRIIAFAAEAVDNSASGTHVRIQVETA